MKKTFILVWSVLLVVALSALVHGKYVATENFDVDLNITKYARVEVPETFNLGNGYYRPNWATSPVMTGPSFRPELGHIPAVVIHC